MTSSDDTDALLMARPDPLMMSSLPTSPDFKRRQTTRRGNFLDESISSMDDEDPVLKEIDAFLTAIPTRKGDDALNKYIYLTADESKHINTPKKYNPLKEEAAAPFSSPLKSLFNARDRTSSSAEEPIEPRSLKGLRSSPVSRLVEDLRQEAQNFKDLPMLSGLWREIQNSNNYSPSKRNSNDIKRNPDRCVDNNSSYNNRDRIKTETKLDFNSSCGVKCSSVKSRDRQSSLVNSRTNIDGSSKIFDSLPALSSLWNDTQDLNPQILAQKVEEEKLRREHCESVIHKLQKQILEQQQQLKVAMEVDSTKESAISTLKKACTLTMQRSRDLEENLRVEKCNIAREMGDLFDVILDKENRHLHFDDLRKILPEYKNKINSILSDTENLKRHYIEEINEIRTTLAEKEERILELKESHGLIVQLNKQLSDNFSLAQNNLAKAQEDIAIFQEKINNLKVEKESLEEKVASIKSEYEKLENKMTEEKTQCSKYMVEKVELESKIEEATKRISFLQAEYEHFKNVNLSQKNEMKTYYQNQVDDIVSSKVKEFQLDMEKAKSFLAIQMENKEKDIALQFARHLQRVEHQHQSELNILEEKHKEHVKLYKIQLNKSGQINQHLEDKISSMKNKRTEVAAQLHNVMENQWQQALKIITNESIANSPLPLQNKPDVILNNSETDSEQQFIQMATRKPSNVQNKPDNKFVNEQLQHYIKILLQKTPRFDDVQNEVKDESGGDGGSANIELLSNSKTENLDKKAEQYTKSKPPWK